VTGRQSLPVDGVVVSPGMLWLSSSQLPRSINLQRSLQKGRQRCLSEHSTGVPQVGHLTNRVGLVEDTGAT